MDEKKKKSKKGLFIGIYILVLVVLFAASIFVNSGGSTESIKEAMKDAVLHETGKISFFGLMEVNPAVISAFTVTAIILVLAIIIRIFVIPRFKMVPGKFQMLLEEWVNFFQGIAKTNSPHNYKILSFYIFTAGSYIFLGTLFELFGFQVVNTHGASMALPAPLADINAAICVGVMTFFFIMSGGIMSNGIKGVFKTLKEFSLPISMSFRLFGALLSGLLVTELVYFYFALSFVLPVFVGVMFTLLHALIQTYVMVTLTSVFYGEVSERSEKKKKKKVKEEIVK